MPIYIVDLRPRMLFRPDLSIPLQQFEQWTGPFYYVYVAHIDKHKASKREHFVYFLETRPTYRNRSSIVEIGMWLTIPAVQFKKR